MRGLNHKIPSNFPKKRRTKYHPIAIQTPYDTQELVGEGDLGFEKFGTYDLASQQTFISGIFEHVLLYMKPLSKKSKHVFFLNSEKGIHTFNFNLVTLKNHFNNLILIFAWKCMHENNYVLSPCVE